MKRLIAKLFGIKDNAGKRVRENDMVKWTDSDGHPRYDLVSWNTRLQFMYLCNWLFSIDHYRPFYKLTKGEVLERLQSLEDAEVERRSGKETYYIVE